MIKQVLSWFTSQNMSDTQDRDDRQFKKIQDSQNALLAAATATADAAQDVTGILRDRLDDSLRQLDITSKMLSDGLILCSSTGVIETVNPSVVRMFDWLPTEIVGKNISMLFKSIYGNDLNLDDLIGLFGSEQMVYDPYSTDNLDYIHGKRKDGNLFWVDGEVTYIDRYDGSTKLMFLFRDVTAKVNTFKTLEQNEHRYRSIFEQSFDSILVIQNHYIVAANPAVSKALGYDSEEMIAQPLTNYIHQDFRTQITKFHTDRMEGADTTIRTTIQLLHKNGTTVDVLWVSTPLVWEGLIAGLVTMRNICDCTVITLQN